MPLPSLPSLYLSGSPELGRGASFLLLPIMPHPFLAFLCALCVAAAAWRAKALTPAGAVAACAVGTTIFALGGWAGAGALLAFFGTSTALSRWRRRAKESLGYEKGGRRDAGQVLANGGVAVGCLLLPQLVPALDMHRAFGLMLGALAAANADTWATEIGSALGAPTVDLRTGRAAAPGTSGAVSLPGTLAALAGAALLGCFAGNIAGWGMVTAAGLAGALGDSGLGATVQAQWRDPMRPGRWTEQAQGLPPTRGLGWVGNDAVNLACTGLGALGVFALQKIFLR